jgi:hypothetical protein
VKQKKKHKKTQIKEKQKKHKSFFPHLSLSTTSVIVTNQYIAQHGVCVLDVSVFTGSDIVVVVVCLLDSA